MNKTPQQPPKMSNRQKARDLSQRVEDLEARMDESEKMLPKFMFATDRATGVLQNQLSHNTEIQDALVTMLGEENVIKVIQESRMNRAIKDAEDRRQQVAQALGEGKLEPEETIRPAVLIGEGEQAQIKEPGSFVAFVEYDPEGKELPYSYACVPVARIKNPAYRDALTGQKVGFEHEVEMKNEENGKAAGKGKLVVLGIYKKKDAPPAPQAAPAAPEASQEASNPNAEVLAGANTEAGEDKTLLDPSVAAPAPENLVQAQA